MQFSVCTRISAEQRFVGLGVTESPTYLHPCDFFVCLVCVLVWDPSVLFQPSKSDRSSAKRNAIYIFHYPLPLSHLTPSFPLSLPSLSDLIFQLFSSLIPPVLALFPCFFLPCFKIDSPLLGSAYTSSVPPTFTLLYFTNWEASDLEAAHLVCGQITTNRLTK